MRALATYIVTNLIKKSICFVQITEGALSEAVEVVLIPLRPLFVWMLLEISSFSY